MNNNFQENLLLDKVFVKKSIRDTAGNNGKMLLVLSIITYISAAIISFILDIRFNNLNLIEENSIMGVSKDAYNFLMGYLPCIIGDIVAIIVGIKLNNISIKKDMLCKSDDSFKFVILSSTSCIAIGMISSTIYLMYSAIIENHGFKIPAPNFSMPSQNIYILLFFLYTCVIAPVFEEIIFRGIILKSFLKYGNLCAILFSSILFSLFHFNLVQFINPILMGIVFSFIVIKTNSIKCSIVAHMFNNSLILLTTVLASFNNNIIQYLFSSIYLIGGFAGFVYFLKDYGIDFIRVIKEKSIDRYSTLKKVFYSFTSFWTILYIFLYIGIVAFTFFSHNLVK